MDEVRFEKTAGCFQFDMELAGYLEGEDKPFVVAHTQDCPFCHVLLADLLEISATARQLPLEEPSPVVWANIRARLEQEGVFREKVGVRTWFQQWRLLHHPAPAAVLACSVLLGSLLLAPPRSLEQQGASPKAASPSQTASASLVYSDEDSSLARTIRDLENTYRSNENSLQPEIKATYEKSLESLDASIRECWDSLRQEPENQLTQEYLMAAYSRKAEVLASAVEYEGR